MRYLVLVSFLSLTGCCQGTRFEPNTVTLLNKRVETNEATINLARKSDHTTAVKLYEDAIIRSSAQLKRIADTIANDTSSGDQTGNK